MYEDADGAIAHFWSRLYLAEGFWQVNGTLAEGPYGRTIVREVTIKPWQGHVAEPTANVLRALSVTTVRDLALNELRARGDFVRYWRERERASGKLVLAITADEEADITRAAELAGPPRPRLGRLGGGDDFYRGVARDALRIVAVGLPVYRTLAEERGVGPEATRKWIARCRTRLFLVGTTGVWKLGPNYGKKEEEQ